MSRKYIKAQDKEAERAFPRCFKYTFLAFSLMVIINQPAYSRVSSEEKIENVVFYSNEQPSAAQSNVFAEKKND